MSKQDFQSFDDFWPFYVKEHQKKSTRILHFIGTTGAMACVAGGLLTKRRWLLAVAPVVGYGPAWISHFSSRATSLPRSSTRSTRSAPTSSCGRRWCASR